MAVSMTVEIKDYPSGDTMQRATVTKYEGLSTYRDGDHDVEAESATYMDFGPLGVSRCFTLPRRPATEEEKKRNRENVYRAAASVLRDLGVW